MSKNAIKLFTLLNENLLEIGDLKNIIPYPITKIRNNKYKFEIGEGDIVDVAFTLVPKNIECLIDTAPIINKEKITSYYNLGYSIKGFSTQAKKTNIKELLKITSTISEIVKEFILTHPNSSIMIFEENKKEELGFTSGQKNLLYKSVISQNLPTEYLSGPVEFNKIEGLIIAPK
jgi:hypothetical protein